MKQYSNQKLQEINSSFALVYLKEEVLYAAVDNIRSFPLFSYQEKDTFYLSDSAEKILNQLKDFQIDHVNMTELLLTGYVTRTETIIKNLSQLPAGTYMVYDVTNNKLVIDSYYRFKHVIPDVNNYSKEELLEYLYHTYEEAFKRLIKTLDGKTAVVPLSGGYDSRCIVAMLKKLGYENVICYSYGKENNHESEISKKIAMSLG